jgi:ParB/RepB/Spo0J family partition protein
MTTANLTQATLKHIPLAEITPDSVGLRKQVDKKHEDWPFMVQDIRKNGIQLPITVRPAPEGHESQYIIIDGLHRYTAAMEICEEDGINPQDFLIPCAINNPSSALEIYLLQMSCNEQKMDTKPSQLRDHLLNIIADGEDNGKHYTQKDLANLTNFSESKIQKLLQLTKLSPEADALVSSGKIKASHAYILARLPQDEQEHWLDRAQAMSVGDFEHNISSYLAELKQRTRASRPSANEFQPVPRVLSKSVLLDKFNAFHENHFEGIPEETRDARYEELLTLLASAEAPSDFILGVFHGLATAISLDPESIAAQRAEHEAKVAERLAKQAEKGGSAVAEQAAQRAVNVLKPKV